MLRSLKDLFPSSIMVELRRNGMGVTLTFFCGMNLQSNIIIRNLLLLISESFLVTSLLFSWHKQGNSEFLILRIPVRSTSRR